ncbi:MAG TPA: POTRA domain-containing protein, partial [Candidatus Krumholzibacteria bacterium]|nr:POTRA domain-containing protein [Candidatus Krumholzibacteria bacterium]
MMADYFCHNGIYATLVCLAVLTLLARPSLARATEPAPAGPPLHVGEIRIVTRDIFSRHEVEDAALPLRLMRGAMNGLHTNTRDFVLRRELLFRRGDRYEPALLEETERNLRALGWLSDARVTAVDTTADGAVDVLVETHEAWTLSTSFAYSLASGGNVRWNAQASEINFLGYGVTVGGGVGADEDRSWWKVWYRKRRFLGRALWFGIDWSETGDGHVHRVFLSRPFYAADDARGIDAEVSDSDLERRWYLSNAGPSGVDPAAEASLYAKIPVREKRAVLQAVWRTTGRGASRVWRLGGGAEVTERTWRLAPAHVLSDGRSEDLGWLAAPGLPMARESRVRVFPYAWVQSVGRRWTVGRFVLQYGATEDIPADAVLEARLGPAPHRRG